MRHHFRGRLHPMGSVLLCAVAIAGCAQNAQRQTQMAAPVATPQPAARAVAAPDSRAIDAEVARIMAGQFSQMPPVQQVQRSVSSVTEIVTRNDTSYRLVLLFSGATSQRLNLAPRETGTVRVQPGDYAVAASVEGASNVRPFAGRQTYEGGRYQSTWYIAPSARP